MKDNHEFKSFTDALKTAEIEVDSGEIDSIDKCIRALITVEKKYYYEKDRSTGRLNEIKTLITSYQNS